MNWFFNSRSKQKISIDDLISCLHVDAHNHLLPGIDDGAKNLDESIFLVKGLQDLGFKKIITTPHIYSAHYPNSAETIKPREKEVQDELKKLQVNIPFNSAAEYYFEPKLAEKPKESLLFLKNQEILIEFDMQQAPNEMWKEVFFNLQLNGIGIVLAHIERYTYNIGQIKWVEELKNMGVYIQMNLGSLIGNYGFPTEKWALQLINNGMIDLLCTDLHNAQQLHTLQSKKDKILSLNNKLDINLFNQLLK